MPRSPLTKKKSPLIAAAASYLLTEDSQVLLAEDGSDVLTTDAPAPLTRKRTPVVTS